MSTPFSISATILVDERRGQALIALGLSVLFMALGWPALPAVTGMSLIALGATIAADVRWNSLGQTRLLLAVHLAVYGNLYLVFVGAACHAAITGPRHGLSGPQELDLILSTLPIWAAVRLAISRRAGGGPVR